MLLQTIVRNFVNMETTGNKIKRLRKSKGLSLMDLAKMVEIPDSARSKVEPGKTKNISDTALSKLETGKTTSITIDLGKSIAKALEISFNELFDIEVDENKGQEVELKTEINRLNDLINSQKEFITILKEQNEILKPFRSAFIQERTISELMVYASIERMKELAQKGEKIEITSPDVRQDAITIYQREFPDIELNSYLLLPPSEIKKKH